MDEKKLYASENNTTTDTSFFPSIPTTSNTENLAIQALIEQANKPRAEEILQNSQTIAVPVIKPTSHTEETYSTAQNTVQDDAHPKNDTPTLPNFVGLIPAIRARYQDSPALSVLFTILLGLVLGISLVATLCIMASIYIACAFAVLLASLILIAICAALLAVATGGLCYGIVQLFTHGILVGLLEVGLALILSGIVLALNALCNELTRGQLPRLLRFLTRKFWFLLRCLIAFVLGSKLFTKKDKKEAQQ